ncbi:MAG: phosphoglucosamine mutase [Flavobacteriales bacterium]
MTLISSISGIRGTIGGHPGEGLSPIDIAKFSAGYGDWLREQTGKKSVSVVLGRDARTSGEMASRIVSGTLLALGIDVIDAGLSTTPTVEMAVIMSKSSGGIIITASHNPAQWNALKLLNAKGEFLNAEEGMDVLQRASAQNISFAPADKLGQYTSCDSYIDKHIDEICNLGIVDTGAIKKAGFKVVVDAVNSTGGIAVPLLLGKLGVKEIVELHCEPNGNFPHNPEPLPENMAELADIVVKQKADLGIAVDPDVDRLALVCEDGEMFGEEYTLVAVADYVLGREKGNAVSNLSSTRALQIITERAGGQYAASAVGEVHVVAKMKETAAVIGGEGNGGVIYPKLHCGRDALVGIAIFLTHLAKFGKSASMLRSKYPDFFISKNKVELEKDIDTDHILEAIAERYSKYTIDRTDGVWIDFGQEWVHLRRSNTEPIIRIYAEGDSRTKAESVAGKILSDISEAMRSR